MKFLFQKKYLPWILKIILTVLFLYFVNRTIPKEEFSSIVAALCWPTMVVAFLLSIAGLYFQVKRWEIILRFQEFFVGKQIPLKTILWGNLLAFITPGRIGELFRGLMVSKTRKADALFAVVIDKLFIIFTVLLFGLLGIVLLYWHYNLSISKEIKIFVIIAGIVCTGGVGILFSGKIINRNHTVVGQVLRLLKNIPRLLNPAGRRAMMYSMLAHLCLCLQSAILLNMFGAINLAKGIVSAALAYGVMPFLSFTIGNMGVREGALGFFLRYLNANHSSTLSLESIAFGTSISILAMNLLLPALGGLIWYFLDNDQTTTIQS